MRTCARKGKVIVKFGVFDHMDRAGQPLGDFYRDRLAMSEGYDTAGFHALHVAEHHSTPLGMSPAPSVFLSWSSTVRDVF